MTDQGIMLCGHGSRDANAVAEFETLARRVAERLPGREVEFGFLEFARPIIRDGLDKLRARGVTDVLAVPGMLFAAGHAKNDIPSVLNTYQAQHPGMTIRYGRELEIDPKLVRAAGSLIDEALARVGDDVSPQPKPRPSHNSRVTLEMLELASESEVPRPTTINRVSWRATSPPACSSASSMRAPAARSSLGSIASSRP